MTNEVVAYTYQTEDWKPIPRIARTIPFGYEVDPDDDSRLLPVVFELEALKKAEKLRKQKENGRAKYSYRVLAEWLTATTERYISHNGLKRRLEREQRQRYKAGTLKGWARRVKKADAILKTFEEREAAREYKVQDNKAEASEV